MSIHTVYAPQDRERVREAKANGVAVSSLRPEVKPIGWDARWRQYGSTGDTSFRGLASKGWSRLEMEALDRLVDDIKIANQGNAPRAGVLALFLQDLHLGEDQSEAPTLHAFAFETFMPYVLKHLKPGTQDDYAKHIEERIVQEVSYMKDAHGRYLLEGSKRQREYVVSELGAMHLDRITRADIVKWMTALQEKWGRRTCELAFGALSSMLSFAVELELVSSNPALGMGRTRGKRRNEQEVKPVKPNRVVNPLNVELLRRYFLLRGHLRDWLVTGILAYAGLRPGELVVLYWRELIDEHGRAREHIQLEHSQSEGIDIDGTKTGWRYIKVFEPLREDIEYCYRAQGSPPLDSRAFLTSNGTLLNSTTWTERLRWSCRKLGVKHFCAYDLRHSAASYLGCGGDEERGKPWTFTEIGAQLGHSPKTCAEIYQHVVEFREYRGIPIEQLIRTAKAAAQEQLICLDSRRQPVFAMPEAHPTHEKA